MRVGGEGPGGSEGSYRPFGMGVSRRTVVQDELRACSFYPDGVIPSAESAL